MGACCSSEEKKHKKKKRSRKTKKDKQCCGASSACYCECCCGDTDCCGNMKTSDPSMAVNLGRILSLNTMGFDEDGNLRHGFNRRDRLGEMQQIIFAESRTKKKETKWAIVDATWLYQWLAYVNSEDHSVPAPGPCHNFRLVRRNEIDGQFHPRIGLVMEKNGKMGDYRKISLRSWEAFKKLYPGSYPDITATFDYYDVSKGEIDPHAEDGYYPTNNWVVAGMKERRKSTLSLFERFGIGRKASYTEPEEPEEGEEEGDGENATKNEEKTIEQAAKRAQDALTTETNEDKGEEEGEDKGGEEVPAPPLAPADSEQEKLLDEKAPDDTASHAEGAATAADDNKEKKPTKAELQPPAPPARPVVKRRDQDFYDDIFNRNSEQEEDNL